MNVTCPSCGAEMDLDVLLASHESREALAWLAHASLPLPKLLVQYVRLFKPATRAMSQARFVKLVGELLPDMRRGAIDARGREWSAPLPLWQAAFERMLEQRDKGELTLPLTTHGYLHAVIVGLADKAEAVAERDVETARRGRAHLDGAQPVGAVLAGSPAGSDSTPPLVPIVAPATTQPSRYARKRQAEIEAIRKARAANGELREGDAALREEGAGLHEPCADAPEAIE